MESSSLWAYRNKNAAKDSRKAFAVPVSKEGLADTFRQLTTMSGVSEAKRVTYLNAIVKLLKNEPDIESLGFSVEDILYYLRPLCYLDSTKVKNATFRAVRHLLRSEGHVDIYNRLKYDFLVAREVTGGGIQLCRRILVIAPHKLTQAPVRSLVSFVHPTHSDQLQTPALAFLAELALLNSDLFIACGGVTAVIRNIPYLKSESMTEALIGSLLYLINRPETRAKAAINLHCVTGSVYMDRALYNEGANDLDSTVRWGTSAMVCLLKSWTGLLHLCQGHLSTIVAIVDSLYVSHLQRPILEVLFKLFDFKQPEWTDEISVAIDAVNPSRWQDSFRIADGFVASEVQCTFPHIAKSRVNLLQVHRATVLYLFLSANILEAIVHVIVSEDTYLSVYATILLGELLHLVHTILPPELFHAVAPGLPDLLSYAVRGHPVNIGPINKLFDFSHRTATWNELFGYGASDEQSSRAPPTVQERSKEAQDRALRAVCAIAKLHTQTSSPSLYLRHLVSWIKSPSASSELHDFKMPVTKLFALNSCDESIKESGILTEKDPFKWDWEVIRAVLKRHDETLRKTTDSYKKLFIQKICEFITPACGQYGRTQLGSDRKFTSRMTLAGLDLISVLIRAPEDSELQEALKNLLQAVAFQLQDLKLAHSAHDSHLSPTNIANSLCQDYFLMIGYLTSSEKGQKVLQAANIYEQLMLLAANTNQDCYVKLIVSTLNFSKDEMSRSILKKIFESKTVSCRMYATKALHAMLRIGVGHDKSLTTFLIGLIVDQLSDEDRYVAAVALNALQEASYCKEYIEAIVDQHPCLMRHGDNGLLVLVRCLSTLEGFRRLNRANFVHTQLDKWGKHYNYRYVNLVESLLTSENEEKKDVFLPPHLYQQLASHSQGLEMVLADAHVNRLVEVLHAGKCTTDAEILESKAALYALSGIAAVMDGSVVISMIRNCTQCPVYSVRAVAFMALCNVATSAEGVEKLKNSEWFSVKHNRHDRWPIIAPTDDVYATCQEMGPMDNDKSPLFDLPEEEEGEESFWALPGGGTQKLRDRRSATLPHSTGAPSFYHNRSFSESKAEHGDAPYYVGEQVAQLRYEAGRKSRSNSYTDSSTSGDSTYGPRHYSAGERFSTLSPIPSTSCLGPLPLPTIRRHNSLSHSAKTAEALRDSRRNVLKELEQNDTFPLEFILKSTKKRPSLRSSRENWPEPEKLPEPDFSILDHSPSETVVEETATVREEEIPVPVYMGICLPLNIQCILPTEERNMVKKRVAFVSSQLKDRGLEDLKNPAFHRDNCFMGPKGSHNILVNTSECEVTEIQPGNIWDLEKDTLEDSMDSSITDIASVAETPPFLMRGRTTIRNELNRMVEQLSNPILHKTCKTSLLQIKQAHEDLFSDVCVFSDVCHILSTCQVRIDSRTFIHEMFDSPFPEVWEDAVAALNRKLADPQQPAAAPSPTATDATPIITTVTNGAV
ncbi:Rapamycin-insensitive companion of [Nesidiocoris tenuis]|uniref:Rapamycin-insensitive companion of n=1 Tax=Nesidiocoris tenuis TaxID=355587 RepID=A0ABN7AJX7_9HEMI|nr:Rapamycin-insensitive companion of [Nesidiocoris tenuis]